MTDTDSKTDYTDECIKVIRDTLDETPIWDKCDKATDFILGEITRLRAQLSAPTAADKLAEALDDMIDSFEDYFCVDNGQSVEQKNVVKNSAKALADYRTGKKG